MVTNEKDGLCPPHPNGVRCQCAGNHPQNPKTPKPLEVDTNLNLISWKKLSICRRANRNSKANTDRHRMVGVNLATKRAPLGSTLSKASRLSTMLPTLGQSSTSIPVQKIRRRRLSKSLATGANTSSSIRFHIAWTLCTNSLQQTEGQTQPKRKSSLWWWSWLDLNPTTPTQPSWK